MLERFYSPPHWSSASSVEVGFCSTLSTYYWRGSQWSHRRIFALTRMKERAARKRYDDWVENVHDKIQRGIACHRSAEGISSLK